jgi:phosphatidylserine/phosphatidylglycerophosphate/cardiolipin synthase-like enzyme
MQKNIINKPNIIEKVHSSLQFVINLAKQSKFFFLIIMLMVNCKTEQKNSLNTIDHCAAIRSSNDSTIDTYLEPLDSLIKTSSAAFVLEDGDGSMIARAWLTANATKTIDIQYFIFSIDNIGLIACDYLVRAADRGVKVRILVDDIMVDAEAEDVMVMDAHPNIEIKIYNPGINLGKNLFQKLTKTITDFRAINQRMHNKIFMADGKTVITGGRNIADEYFDYDHEYNFRDRDIFLIGKVCAPIKQSFESFWNHELSVPVATILKDELPIKYQSSLYDKLHQYACDTTNYWPQIRERVSNIPVAFQHLIKSGDLVWSDSIHYVSDDPGKNDGKNGLKGSGKSTEELIKLIKSAQYSIDIQSPYLVTTDESRQLLADAVARGVKIRILTNSLASTDNLEAFSGYQRDRKKLLKTGAHIYEFRPDAACRMKLMTGALREKPDFQPIFGLHAKSMIIDDKTAIIGTFNLDPRSTHLNTECFVVVNNKALTHKMKTRFDDEFKPENAWQTTTKWNPDGEVSLTKRAGTYIRKVVPKSIL